MYISSRHSNLNFAQHFVIYWLFQNGANKNQHQDSYQRETVPDKFVFFSKLVRQKKSIGWAEYVYICVFEICAEGIFVTFPWWLENMKSRSKIALFSNERHFEIWFPKKRTIMFFCGKLSTLHKKDPILHVPTIFSLKQGETRTSHGPIPHPLSQNTWHWFQYLLALTNSLHSYHWVLYYSFFTLLTELSHYEKDLISSTSKHHKWTFFECK